MDNAVENFCQAILHEAENLKKLSTTFIKTHKNAVKVSQGWKDIPQKYPNIVEQILFL